MEKDSPFIKCTAFGFTYERWIDENESYLPSLLLSVMMNWQRSIDQSKPTITDKIRRKQLDEIESAIDGMVSDLHNLAVNYDLMTRVIATDEYKGTGLIGLYLGLLTENYVTNIRSIYDFCSVFPRIIMSAENVELYKKFNTNDSLWTLLNAVKGKARVTNNATGERLSICKESLTKTLSDLPDYLISLLHNTSERLNIINEIRNGIVHQGDEPFIQFNGDQPIIRLPKKYPNDKTNKLPNILELDESTLDYPLFDYLKVLTHDLFEFMENLGTALFQKDIPFDLWILDNKCMAVFISYFRYDIGKHIRKTADGKGLEFGIVGMNT
jgi:hypothetical protein